MGIIKGMRREVRRKMRAKSAPAPRFVCTVCGRSYDTAILPPDTLPQPIPCADCKLLLSEGNTALVTMNPDRYCFVKFTDEALAGKIVPLSKENFDKWEAEFNRIQSEKESHEQSKPSTSDPA